MLQEILLSLSGHPSPLLQSSTDRNQHLKSNSTFPLLSPPERALLDSLAHLSNLHQQIRSSTSTASASHPSTICRAVAGTIASDQLGRFQQKVLEVEKFILEKDAGYVGGYGIVPLSTVVGDFAIWTRRMEWLWRVMQFMTAKGDETEGQDTIPCTGPSLINFLRKEHVQTGYVDIEGIAQELVQTAETAWMRQLSAWMLYGKLPAFGAEDFFIREVTSKDDGSTAEAKEFSIHTELLPNFVTSASASSILFVGKSLNRLRAMNPSLRSNAFESSSSSENALLSTNLQYLSSITYPLTSAGLTRVVESMRRALSQTTLARLLSVRKVTELLSVLQEFLLLDRGEFAVALISRADEQMRQRHRKADQNRNTKLGHGPLDGISIKDVEVGGVLARVWADLTSLQGEEGPVDDDLDLAQDILYLSLRKSKLSSSQAKPATQSPNSVEKPGRVLFDDFLFPAPAKLSVRIQPPLDLFWRPEDLESYSSINSYLLSIRRAHLHLSSLWKQTSLRREHPAPLGPPLSNTNSGGEMLLRRRQKSNERTRAMRKVWATSGSVLFLLSEVGGYLQGKVVNGHWNHFRRWLVGVEKTPSHSTSASRPGTSSATGPDQGLMSFTSSMTHAANSVSNTASQRDPETLTAAHKTYLDSLLRSLLLDDLPFTSTVRTFLFVIDRFIGLLTRLQTIQQNLDLETDEGVVDTLADYASDEQEVTATLLETRKELELGIKSMVEKLRDVEEHRHGMATASAPSNLQDADVYVPWKGPGVDQLLMKLDFGSLNTESSAPAGEE